MKHVVTLFVLLALANAGHSQEPLPPAALPGPLVMVGGGTTTSDIRRAFFDLAGKAKARIVFISTANDDAGDSTKDDGFAKPWKSLEPASVDVLHAKDRKQADDPAFVKPLTEATAVWFAEGSPSRILDTYRGTLVEKELQKLHERGGAIGGTLVSLFGSRRLDAGESRLGPGFGFLPGFALEHKDLRGSRLTDALKTATDHIGVTIDDETALIAQGRHLRVIGKKQAMILPMPTREPLFIDVGDGQVVDLIQLRRMAANRAAKVPFPPANVREPVVEKGSLVIVGGGGAGPEIWKKFIDLAGGPESLIVFVPTALEDPIGFTFPEVSALQKYGAKSIQILHTRDRARADDPKFSEPLTRAKGVWFGGGRQWRFVEAYEGTLTEKRFHDVLTRGGVIGGSSAGASIQSEYMPRGHPLGNTVMMAEGYERGFGFLPGAAVDQHFFARKRTQDMTRLITAFPQFLGIGIDEGTAIVVTGSAAEVIGRTKVGFYDYRNGRPKSEKDYTEVSTGEKYDMKERKVVK